MAKQSLVSIKIIYSERRVSAANQIAHICAPGSSPRASPFRLGMNASRGRCIRLVVRGPLHKLTLMPHEGLSVNSVKVRNVL